MVVNNSKRTRENMFRRTEGDHPAQILRTSLPWLAMSLSVGLSMGLGQLNAGLCETAAERAIACAGLCIVGGFMYIVLMLANRLLALVLASLEVRKGTAHYAKLAAERLAAEPDSISQKQKMMMSAKTAPSSVAAAATDDEDALLISPAGLDWQQFINSGIRRDDVISSMYLGGVGAFLSLPGLCMWDASAAAALVMSLQLGSIFEHVKVVEYRRDVDRAEAMQQLKRIHVARHVVSFAAAGSVMWLDIGLRWPRQSGNLEAPLAPILMLSFFAPMLMRAGCPPLYTTRRQQQEAEEAMKPQGSSNNNNEGGDAAKEDGDSWSKASGTSFVSYHRRLWFTQKKQHLTGIEGGVELMLPPRTGLTPSHVLETGLPVSILLAVTVLFWFNGTEIAMQERIQVGHFIPMVILMPPSLGACVAFILRGFQRRQTLDVVTVAATALMIRREAVEGRLLHAADWVVLVLTLTMVALTVAWHVVRDNVVACDEDDYAEIRLAGKVVKRDARPVMEVVRAEVWSSPYTAEDADNNEGDEVGYEEEWHNGQENNNHKV